MTMAGRSITAALTHDLAAMVLSHMQQLRPGEDMIHVILEVIAVAGGQGRGSREKAREEAYFSGKHQRFEFCIWMRSAAVAWRMQTMLEGLIGCRSVAGYLVSMPQRGGPCM